MITHYKSYYWLIRFRYFAYTFSPSPWTYPSGGRYSLAVVAMHLLKLCCSLCCSPEYLQHAFLVLICKILEKYFLLHAVCDWFASQHWAGEIAPISRSPCSVLDHSPDCEMEHSPHGLFALPAALHAWERTHHFKQCSYVIFASNTDEIRGVSIVKNVAVICHYHFRQTFRCDFVNTDTCVKNTATYYCSIIIIIWAYGFLHGYIGWHS